LEVVLVVGQEAVGQEAVRQVAGPPPVLVLGVEA
jgi:hypothetical protein